jgi:hypothetical protein
VTNTRENQYIFVNIQPSSAAANAKSDTIAMSTVHAT